MMVRHQNEFTKNAIILPNFLGEIDTPEQAGRRVNIQMDGQTDKLLDAWMVGWLDGRTGSLVHGKIVVIFCDITMQCKYDPTKGKIRFDRKRK
jgi:hypothetical protein